jgi:hypothetical protein
VSRSALAILAIAILVSFGMWLSVRAAGLAEIELLPGRCRRRVRWWQGHARYAQLCCALAALAAAGVQISTSVG